MTDDAVQALRWVRCRAGSLETLEQANAQREAVRCRAGSLEKSDAEGNAKHKAFAAAQAA